MFRSIAQRSLQLAVLSLVFSATVQAQTAPAAAAPGGFPFDPQILMLVAIAAVFYFLLIRPQSQKAKRHREMLKTIKRGDRILTAGGIIGIVAKVIDDTEVSVTIAKDVDITVARGTISDILPEVKAKAVTSAEVDMAAKAEAAGQKPSFFAKIFGSKPKASESGKSGKSKSSKK